MSAVSTTNLMRIYISWLFHNPLSTAVSTTNLMRIYIKGDEAAWPLLAVSTTNLMRIYIAIILISKHTMYLR